MKSAALLLALSLPFTAAAQTAPQQDVSLYLTTPDRSSLLKLQSPIAFTTAHATTQVIDVNPAKTYQTIDGFGFALTGGSAQLLMHMALTQRDAILHELFTRTGDGIGVSYLRITVGSSDMSDHVYSYDDLAAGETDVPMAHFSLQPDQASVIPS
jgi:glucosylceramidase